MKEEFSFEELKSKLNSLQFVLKKSFVPIILIAVLGGATGYYFKPDGTYVSGGLLSNGFEIENPYLADNFSIESSKTSIQFEEIETLLNSEKLLDEVLLTQCKVNGREDLLANHIIQNSELEKATLITTSIKDLPKEKTLKLLTNYIKSNLDVFERKGKFTVVEFQHENDQIAVVTATQIIKTCMTFLSNEYLPNYSLTIEKLSAASSDLKKHLVSLSQKEKLSYEDNLEIKRLEAEYFQNQKQLAFFNSRKLNQEVPVKVIDMPSSIATFKIFPTWLIITLCSFFSLIFATGFFLLVFLFSKQFSENRSFTLR